MALVRAAPSEGFQDSPFQLVFYFYFSALLSFAVSPLIPQVDTMHLFCE